MSMSFNAHDMSIGGGNYVSAEVYNVFNSRATSNGMDLLRRNVAAGAFHNASERFDPPKCHPNTRVSVLKKIMSWVEKSDTTSTPIMWLHGPAGAGKSAIVQGIAEKCEDLGLLAASFFFSRTAVERNNEKHLIPTIAYQLTLSIPGLRPFIEKAVEDDPLIFSRDLEAQMEVLVVKPLAKIAFSRNFHYRSVPILITLDGLDECYGFATQRLILKVLSTALMHKLEGLCLVASRPERMIQTSFNLDENLRKMTCCIVLDDSFQPDDDIEIFLRDHFHTIRSSHPIKSLIPISWPSPGTITALVRKSSGQFIYAATVIKYIESEKHNPVKRLEIVLGIESPRGDTPFAQLDALYEQILQSVDNIDRALQILEVVFFMAARPVHDASYSTFHPTRRFIEEMLSLEAGDLYLALSDLHPVLHVPEPGREDNSPVRILHESLGDFLMDYSRSGRFFIDVRSSHARIAQCCLKIVSSQRLTTISAGRANDPCNYSLLSLVFHITQAVPTPDLLRELELTDLTDVFRKMKRLAQENESSIFWQNDLLELLSWSKSINHDLSSSHTKCSAAFLISELRNYPWASDDSLLYFLVLVAANCQVSSALRYCRNVDFPPECLVRTYKFDQTALRLVESKQPFRSYLASFLEDPQHAAEFLITGDTYARFTSNHLKQALIRAEHRRQVDDGNTMGLYGEMSLLQDLPLLLDKASPSIELANCLQDVVLHFSQFSRPHLRATDLPEKLRYMAKKYSSNYIDSTEISKTPQPHLRPGSMVPKDGINSQWVYVYVKHSSMKLALFGFLFPALVVIFAVFMY